MTFGFVGDPGSFLSQCQRDSRRRGPVLTVRLTVTRAGSKPGYRLSPCLTDWRLRRPPLPEITLIPRIETPDLRFLCSIRLADFGTLTVTLALVPGLICSGKLTLAAVVLPRILTVAWALVTWQLLPFESLLGQLILTAAKLLVFERLTGLPEFSLLIVGGVEVGPVSPVGPVGPVSRCSG